MKRPCLRNSLCFLKSSSSFKPGWMAIANMRSVGPRSLLQTPSTLSQSHVSPCNSSKPPHPSRPAMSGAIRVNRQKGHGLILVFRWDANINWALFANESRLWRIYWRPVWPVLIADLLSQGFITTSGFEVRDKISIFNTASLMFLHRMSHMANDVLMKECIIPVAWGLCWGKGLELKKDANVTWCPEPAL